MATKNSVKKNCSIMLAAAIFASVFLISCGKPALQSPEVLEKDLKFYPSFFFDKNGSFNSVIIVDELASKEDYDSANQLLQSFSKIDKRISADVIKKYPNYSDLLTKNAILIGSCSQEPKNRFVNIYTDCLSMKPEQALIRIVDNHGAWLLFVVGSTPEKTNNAVKVLANYKKYNLTGNDVEVIDENGVFRIGEPT